MSASERAEALTWRFATRRGWRKAVRRVFRQADAERAQQRQRGWKPFDESHKRYQVDGPAVKGVVGSEIGQHREVAGKGAPARGQDGASSEQHHERPANAGEKR